MTADWRELLRPEVLGLRGYAVEDPGDLVKLDANENPYPPPAALLARIAERVRDLELNRYPDPEARRLRALLAGRFDWPVEGILLGNGSDELIVLLLAACGGEKATLLVPAPTFSMYRHLALVSGWGVAEVPLTRRFELDGPGMAAAAHRVRPRLTALATPNNPTGNRFDEGAVSGLLGELPGILVLDEAYHDFAGRTALELAKADPRVVVLRTLSKIGMAALRVGALLAHPDLARELDKVRLPYNVSSFSQVAAVAALEEPGYLEAQIATLVAERARLAAALAALPGVEVFPSEANFLLLRTARPSRDVFEGLRGQGVLVRDLGGAEGLLHRCLRVTVGTPRENDRFLEVFRGLPGR